MNKANVKGNSLENLKGEVMIGEMVGSHPHIVHMKEFVENTDRCPAAAAPSFHPAAAAAALSPLALLALASRRPPARRPCPSPPDAFSRSHRPVPPCAARCSPQVLYHPRASQRRYGARRVAGGSLAARP